MTTLVRISDSGLYGPDSAETFVFLLSDPPAEPPVTIALEETWEAQRRAPRTGFYVFLDALPSDRDASVLADALRCTLPPNPATTGFGWAHCPPSALSPAGAVDVTMVGGCPAVASDAPIQVRSPMPELTIPAGLAVRAQPGLAGWTLTDPYSRQDAGVTVPLLGRDCGDIRFRALLASTVKGDATVKRLADVHIDPVRPFDSTRTRITLLSDEYSLALGPAGTYQLTRMP